MTSKHSTAAVIAAGMALMGAAHETVQAQESAANFPSKPVTTSDLGSTWHGANSIYRF